jgi:uncharacterized protein YaiE (UPF0345 family)
MLNVNEYFEGRVKSISLDGGDLPATVGVMAPGKYTFDTSQREYVTVICGELVVKLPGAGDWQAFKDGETFTVEAGQSFDLRVERDTAYFCKYE